MLGNSGTQCFVHECVRFVPIKRRNNPRLSTPQHSARQFSDRQFFSRDFAPARPWNAPSCSPTTANDPCAPPCSLKSNTTSPPKNPNPPPQTTPQISSGGCEEPRLALYRDVIAPRRSTVPSFVRLQQFHDNGTSFFLRVPLILFGQRKS